MALRRGGAPSEDRLALIGEAAQLYYIERYTQDRIARRLNVSRSNVSRMLKEARNLGLVEIRVRAPMETAPELGGELRSRLGLRECHVLAARSPGGDIGAFGALHLQRHMADGSVLGIGWSSAVHDVVNSGRLREMRRTTVVQLLGSLGGSSPELDGASITGMLAGALGARRHHLLQAPVLVADAAVREGLLRDRHIARTLELAGGADVLMFGVGTVDRASGQYRAGYLDDQELDYIRGQGAIGEVCGFYFSRDGSFVPVEMNRRTIGLGFEDFRRVGARVAMGWGASKALPNIGAARAGITNVLVTNEDTAREMLAILDDEAG
jgi:deoxyribonucleoside regulator